MKYFYLVWPGIWHKPRRTFLTMATIVVAFMLYGLLQGVDQGADAVIKTFNNHLFTGNKNGTGQGVPVSYLEKIKKVPGVGAVTHWTFFGGFYREPRNSVAVFATDSHVFQVYAQDFKLPKDQVAAMANTRTAAVVAKPLAEKYRWKIGQRVTLRTSLWTQTNGRDDYQFDIVGIMPVDPFSPNPTLREMFLINYSYLDEARAFQKGKVHYLVSSIKNVKRTPEIAKAIDSIYANSADETVSTPESALMQSQLRQLLDFGLIVNLIMSAVFLTLLLVTANSIAQSVRERIPDFAVLKTIGFADSTVTALIFLESTVLCVFAAAIGLGIARGIFGLLGMLFGLSMPSAVIVQGFGFAVLLALLSGLAPTLRIQRLNLINALAHR
jgi:putative ABC transport system permease protein